MAATVASADFYSEDAASPQTAAKPTSTASGDLLVYVIAQGDSTLANLTAPSGWLLITSANGGSVTGKAWQKVATGSEPATYDFPYTAGADVAAVMFRVPGADTTPTIVSAVGTAGPNGGACDSPTVTPTGVDDLLIAVMSAACGGTTLVETDPTGMTDLGQGQVSGGFQATAAAYQQLVSSAATGAKTWSSITPATKPGVTFSLAIKSAAAGGGGAPAFVPAPARRRTPPVPPRPRRSRAAGPLPATPPVPQAGQVHRARVPVAHTRGRLATPTPPQVNPPFPISVEVQPRRVRALAARRGRAITPPLPAQSAPTNPTWIPAPHRPRPAPAILRRIHVWQPPWLPPAAPANPAWLQPPQRPRQVPELLRRNHTWSPTWPQQAATVPPPWLPAPRRPRSVPELQRRSHIAALPAPQPAALTSGRPKPHPVPAPSRRLRVVGRPGGGVGLPPAAIHPRPPKPMRPRRARIAPVPLAATTAPQVALPGRLASAVFGAGSNSTTSSAGLTSASSSAGAASATSTAGLTSATSSGRMVSSA